MKAKLLKIMGWKEVLFMYVVFEAGMIYKIENSTGGRKDYYFLAFILTSIFFIILLIQKLRNR